MSDELDEEEFFERKLATLDESDRILKQGQETRKEIDNLSFVMAEGHTKLEAKSDKIDEGVSKVLMAQTESELTAEDNHNEVTGNQTVILDVLKSMADGKKALKYKDAQTAVKVSNNKVKKLEASHKKLEMKCETIQKK